MPDLASFAIDTVPAFASAKHQHAVVTAERETSYQNGLAQALREFGRIERTLFTLDWIQNPISGKGQQSASIRKKRETRLLVPYSSTAAALFEIAFVRTSRTRRAD